MNPLNVLLTDTCFLRKVVNTFQRFFNRICGLSTNKCHVLLGDIVVSLNLELLRYRV